MTFTGTKELFHALNAAGVRYLVAGGLAVVAHGFVRLTVDTDLVVELEDEDNLHKGLRALSGLGYRPRIPVDLFDFANRDQRERWIKEKGMVVFQLTSDQFPANNVDLFAAMPFDFSTEYEKAVRVELEPGMDIPVVTCATLIAMKQKAGRDKDKMDIEYLRRLQKERDEEKG